MSAGVQLSFGRKSFPRQAARDAVAANGSGWGPYEAGWQKCVGSASLAHGAILVLNIQWRQHTRRTAHQMFRYTLSYARYVLTALSTIGFKLAAN